jgi:hypothetical protein
VTISFFANEGVTGELQLLLDGATAKKLGLARRVVVGSRKLAITRAGAYILRVKLSATARKRLAKLHTVRLTLEGTLVGTSGRRVAIHRVLRLTR